MGGFSLFGGLGALEDAEAVNMDFLLTLLLLVFFVAISCVLSGGE
jgi:hypothetical protein